MELHPAGAEAAAELAEIHRESFDAPWSAGDIMAVMGDPGVLAFAAVLEARLAGFVLCRVAADEAEVLTIATRPDLRRRGVGSALLDVAAAAVLARGATRLFLEVATDNPAALALYAAHGFAQVGRRPAYYSRPGGAVAALILRRDLNK